MPKTIPTEDEGSFRRYWERSWRLLNASTPREDYRTYRELGYTKEGARSIVTHAAEAQQPARDEPTWGFTEADLSPAQPFSIGAAATAFEWAMLFAGYEPYAPALGGESNRDPDRADHRMFLMNYFAEEFTGNLCRDIEAGRVALVKEAYRHDQPGKHVRDVTKCIISAEEIAKFAERIGGYSDKIAELLAARDKQTSDEKADTARLGDTGSAKKRPKKPPGPPPVLRTACKEKMLADLEQGRRTAEELAGDTLAALAAQYGGSLNTAKAARDEALSEFQS
jgi:hypothetical protein